MSESESTAEATNAEKGATPDEQLGEGGKKALEAERAANKELRKQLAAFEAQNKKAEEAQLTELQKVQSEVKALTERAEKAELTALRKAAIADHRLEQGDEVFLTGTTAEDIEAQAKQLAARFQPGTPAPDPSQGAGQAPALNSSALENALREALGI